jgi:TRAP-type C4-dicarboxylate transport system permease small subunit
VKINRVLQGSKNIGLALQRAEMAIGVVCLAVMLIVMLVNIFFRYVLSKPIFFSDELNNYLFIWMSFLSACFVMGNDGHVRVTAIVSLLPEKAQIVMKLIMEGCMLVVFSLYIIPSATMLGRLKLSSMMRVPLKYVYVIMPIAFGLMGVHIVVNMIGSCGLLVSMHKEVPEEGSSGRKACC